MLDPPSSPDFNDRVEPGNKWDACADQSQAFSPAQSREWDRRHMRRPPNDSPGPRIHRSLFPPRPTAHAQTLKRSPRPLASPEVNEKHTVWRPTSFILII